MEIGALIGRLDEGFPGTNQHLGYVAMYSVSVFSTRWSTYWIPLLHLSV